MLTNLKSYTKMLKTAYSCENIGHVVTTENWADKCLRSCNITRFEYNSIIDILFDKKLKLIEQFDYPQT